MDDDDLRAPPGGVPARVLAARERFRAAIPAGYSPWLHLAAPFVTGGAVIAVCLSCLDGPAPRDLLVVPILWISAIAAEWRFHRDLLHKRRPPLQFFYDAHTVQHHAMYVEGAMEIGAPWEFRAVMFPAFAAAALALLMAPLCWGVAALFGRDAGLLLLASGMAYLMYYEFLHLCFHLPRSHPLRRLRLIEALSRNHTRHHDPRRMMHANFGVTTDLWDRVRGTRE